MTTPQAIALHYDGQRAPRVTAKGEAEVAERILATAREHGVPIHEDVELSSLLSRVALDDEIPLSLFVAIAEVLAFTYRLKGKTPPAHEPRRDRRIFDYSNDH